MLRFLEYVRFSNFCCSFLCNFWYEKDFLCVKNCGKISNLFDLKQAENVSLFVCGVVCSLSVSEKFMTDALPLWNISLFKFIINFVLHMKSKELFLSFHIN